MMYLKKRPPGALWLSDLVSLIRKDDGRGFVYHCYCNSDRPLKIDLKDLEPHNSCVAFADSSNCGLGNLDHVGCNLTEDNCYNDAYVFDNWLFAEAYLINIRHAKQTRS